MTINESQFATSSDDMYREILDGLHTRGFKTNMGYKECGLIPSVIAEAGGYYMGSCIYFRLFLLTHPWDQMWVEASTSSMAR